MKVLQKPRESHPANLKQWRWKTQDGTYLRPCVMTTPHLHNTVVMIWHHRMPANMRVRGIFRKYDFGSFYTAEYLMAAIRVMLAELSSRSDLRPWMEREIIAMRKHLAGSVFEISSQKRIQGAAE